MSITRSSASRALRLRALLVILLLGSLIPSAAQPPEVQAADPTFRPIPFGGAGGAWGLALGDLDRDGALDIVQSHGGSQPIQVFLNDGTGSLLSGTDLSPGTTTESVAVGDMNRDGALDIVASNRGSQSLIYMNDGAGGFPSATPFGGVAATFAVAIGDLNGDGALDIVQGNINEPSLVHLSDGGGGFLAAAPFSAALETRSLALADLNGDGNLDIVQGNVGQSMIYLNNGDGSLQAGAPIGGPAITYSVVVGDIDGDTDIDIVQNIDSAAIVFHRNNGGGSFVLGGAIATPERSYRLALADLNGDGLLDIVRGVYGLPSRIYLNQGAGVFTTSFLVGEGTANLTFSLAIGDLNGDSSLDIVQGNDIQQSVVYLNNGPTQFPAGFSLGGLARTMDVTVGDLDEDGDLDVVQANYGQQSVVFLNDGLGGFSAGAPLSGTANTYQVALGDIDSDGDLDIVQANWAQVGRIYFNDGGGGFPETATFGSPANPLSVALGDIDGDGDLDIVQGNNFYQQSMVYLNGGDGSFAAGIPFGPTQLGTFSIALGDMNGDGALDIVQGNNGQQSLIYLNDGSGNILTGAPFGGVGPTNSIALGDLDGDGALDIVQGIQAQQSIVFLNDQQGGIAGSLPFGGTHHTTHVALGDINGDSALDIVAANIYQPSMIYLGNRVGGFSAGIPLDGPSSTMGVAVGDLNGDGALDLVEGKSGVDTSPRQSKVFLSQLQRPTPRFNAPTTVAVARPGPTADANFYSTPATLDARIIPISYRLTDPEGDPAREVRGFYSLDGGGSWLPAIAATLPLTTTSSSGVEHVFAWDTFASGVLGQSANVVFRLEAYPTLISGPREAPLFQRPFQSSTSFPFRVRGTQVRVVNSQGAPQAGAVIFRLNGGLERVEQLIAPGRNAPAYTTDGNGYLSGRGTLAISDTLIALAPVPLPGPYGETYSDTVRLFQTNIITTPAGISGFTVANPGVQTIVVSATRPLELFDVLISLEWDARNDARFMSQLEGDLARASELLFQATHGQAALGDILIYHDRENWDYADIRIYASNRVRPSATIGGIATQIITDPTTLQTVLYEPGQVAIGAVWNRFGTATGNLSEDWPRTLVHELSHYLFFLQDNYLGLDPSSSAGEVVPVTTCPGIMADLYTSIWQYQTSQSWGLGCADTFSNTSTGRADWETIQTFHPGLRAPSVPTDAASLPLDQLPPGPARLPLALTTLTEVDPLTPTLRLDVPIFYTVDAVSGGRLIPSLNARAFLFQRSFGPPSSAYDRLTPLGRATADQILARGARAGDRLCLFDPPTARFGCETIQLGREQLALQSTSWQPDIRVTPVTSMTLGIEVSGIPSDALNLRASLYTVDNEPLPGSITLTPQGGGRYAQSFDLINPLEGAYIHITADSLPAGAAPLWETVTSVSLGGNPGGFRRIGGGGFRRIGGGGFRRIGGGGFRRIGGGGFSRMGGAPVSSAEGDVLLVADSLTFAEGQFLLLQTTSALPAPPTWATLIGQGYRFTTSASAPDLSGTSLSFNYLDSDVPASQEANIQVYYRGDGDPAWRAIDTTLDPTANVASIPNQGAGLYALMTSVRISLTGQGWNTFAYPVAGSRSVGDALASIVGQYTIVYGYDSTVPAAPWRAYAPAPAPSWVSDLAVLSFGQGYWIHTTQPIDVLLNGGDQSAATRALAPGLSLPPAVIYGALVANEQLTPTPGMPVVATIAGAVCGTATTQQVNGQVVFVVKASALGPETPACGALGHSVTISIAGQPIGAVAWDNTRASDLFGGTQMYLPLVLR